MLQEGQILSEASRRQCGVSRGLQCRIRRSPNHFETPLRNAIKGGCVKRLDGSRAFGGASARSRSRRGEDLDVARKLDWLTCWASFDGSIRLDVASGAEQD